MKNQIAVLLATYNSSKFLKEQLDSLQNQSYKDFRIYVRDDGSTDNTIEILKGYPNITILDDPQKHKGAMGSFMWLLENVEADYYMFCDHDDVWNYNKVELTINRMIDLEQKNQGKPIVVNTDLEVVNENLETIHPSMFEYLNLRMDLLVKFNYLSVYNGFTGCTMMINNCAKKVSIPLSNYAIMHDYWIPLNVIAKGGVLSPLTISTIKYRQHSSNVIGAQEFNKADYFSNRIRDFREIIKDNIRQIKMLNDIKKTSLIKYLFYKILFFIRR